ncbi:helix-turn-helix transcriptional regulator [Nitrosophilus alvini]|uniref:helix-turn-helix transcriptional regulator n=1 Tax=Nitrosophilus alvini TaxID=2714855 RepID=UPI00190C2E3C|nr:WYL domain-containing transcriptional regulator [Nitrosophilus alvini]
MYKKNPATSKTASRLLYIVKKLYNNEQLSQKDLAKFFNVSERTIYRYMKERIDPVIPLRKNGDIWYLSNIETILEIENKLIEKNRLEEDLQKYYPLLETIFNATQRDMAVIFGYTNRHEKFSHKTVTPIKFYKETGLWYLIGYDHEKKEIRTYRVSSISFAKKAETNRAKIKINKISSVWQDFNKEKLHIKLLILKDIVYHIKRSPLHPTQKVVDCFENGDIVIETEITNFMEILPQIKKFIPHIFILSPENIRNSLKTEIENYLEKIDIYKE